MERRSIGGDADAATASSMLVVALEGLVDDEAVTPKTTAHFRNTRILQRFFVFDDEIAPIALNCRLAAIQYFLVIVIFLIPMEGEVAVNQPAAAWNSTMVIVSIVVNQPTVA